MASKFLTASLLASALFAGLGMTPVMAQQGTRTPVVDQTQRAINLRIQQGLASGQITPSEAQVLYRRDREIEARESRFKADGRATAQERQALRADLDALNAEVERMLNNRDRMRRADRADNTPGINNRQFQIGKRIDEGVRSGRITDREARKLHERERDIERRETRAKANGNVSQKERQQLRDDLASLNAEVDRMMTNGQNARGNDRNDNRNDHNRR